MAECVLMWVCREHGRVGGASIIGNPPHHHGCSAPCDRVAYVPAAEVERLRGALGQMRDVADGLADRGRRLVEYAEEARGHHGIEECGPGTHPTEWDEIQYGLARTAAMMRDALGYYDEILEDCASRGGCPCVGTAAQEGCPHA